MDYHKPVLYDEVIENLITNENGVYLDCTLGGAGHTIGILENTGEKSTVVAIDQDEDAIRFAKLKLENYQNRIKIFKDNFKNLDTVLYLAGYEKIDGILMDIGVSSKQLDNPERGFSYKYDAKLDMRMNKNDKLSAYEVVNDFTEKEISDILYKYGEAAKEKFSEVKEQVKSGFDQTMADVMEVTADDKNKAVIMHILSIILGFSMLGFISPLIFYFAVSDNSEFLKQEAKNDLNFQLTLLIAYVIAGILWIVLIGIFLSFVLGICALVFEIMALVKAKDGEHYKFPFSLNLIK